MYYVRIYTYIIMRVEPVRLVRDRVLARGRPVGGDDGGRAGRVCGAGL